MNLTLIKRKDAQELFELTVKNRAYLRKWLPWLDGVQSLADTEEFIERSIAGHKSSEVCNFMIRQGQELVGICGFYKFDWEKKMGFIGYWLGEEFQGQGLMSRACLELEKIASQELGILKLDIRAAELNRPSRAIPERWVMLRKGRFRMPSGCMITMWITWCM